MQGAWLVSMSQTWEKQKTTHLKGKPHIKKPCGCYQQSSTVPVQAAHNPTDSSAWFWKQPRVVYPPWEPGTLKHTQAGLKESIYMWREVVEKLAFWARSLSTPRAGLTGLPAPCTTLRQQLKPLGARWCWNSHISPPQACLPRWRIFCLSWAFALHLSPK